MNGYLSTIPSYVLYEKCLRRLELKGYARKVETAHDFFEGNQWGDSPPDNMPRPVINIIEPIVSYKVAQVSQNGMNLYVDSENEKVKNAFAEKIDAIWEKQDMDNLMYEVLTNSAIAGISAVYSYFDEESKEICCELKDAREILFACEEEKDIEKQDFIMLPYVDSVSRLKTYALNLGVSESEIEMIRREDDESDEVSERCVCVLKLWKEDGLVHFSKFTRHVTLIEDEKTNLTVYPISILPWSENASSVRGNGEVSKIIQNQIEINKNYARRGVSIMDGAYPRIAYLVDMVENPEAIAEVGSAIGVSGSSASDVAKAITYLSPSRISTDAETYTSELIELTRSLAGASDNSIGLVNPEAASGTAILAVQAAQAMPLTRQVAKMRKFVEKLGRIWLEIYSAYLPSGFACESGNKISKKDIVEAIKHLKVEIVSKSPFTTTAVESALMKFLEKDYITFEDYISLLPHGGVGQMVLKDYQIKTPTENEKMVQTGNLANMMQGGVNALGISNGVNNTNLARTANGVNGIGVARTANGVNSSNVASGNLASKSIAR